MTDTIRPEAQSELPFITKEELSGDTLIPPAEHPNLDPQSGSVDHSTESSASIQADIPADATIVDSPAAEAEVSQTTSEVAWYKRTSVKIAGAGLAALSLLGIGAKIGSGSDSSEQARTDVPTTETPALPPTTNVPTTPETLVPTETDEVEGYEPVYMTAEEPAALLDQLFTNYECALNTNDLDTQLECVRYMTGDIDSNIARAFIAQANEAYTYRQTHPDYEYRIFPSVIDFRLTDTRREIIAMIDDRIEIRYKRYVFEQRNATTASLGFDEDPGQPVWVVVATETLEPGEVSFE